MKYYLRGIRVTIDSELEKFHPLLMKKKFIKIGGSIISIPRLYSLVFGGLGASVFKYYVKYYVKINS